MNYVSETPRQATEATKISYRDYYFPVSKKLGIDTTKSKRF